MLRKRKEYKCTAKALQESMEPKTKRLTRQSKRGVILVMELKVHNDTKLVEVWLTNAEKNAPHIQAYLKDIYAKYKSPDYTIAVFQSGSEDLFMKTRDLLAYNKRHSAEHEQKKIRLTVKISEKNKSENITSSLPRIKEKLNKYIKFKKLKFN